MSPAEAVAQVLPGRTAPPAVRFNELPAGTVSWGAIFAGAAAAAALSLILLILGTGLGLSSVSPWSNAGISAATLGVSTIVWLTVTQMVASGMGGYLAGRLRPQWVGRATDEVYFRDTAHGFLSWAVASLLTAALLTSVIGSILGVGVRAGATLAGGVATAATGAAAAIGAEGGKSDASSGPMEYFIDSLFRKETSSTAPAAGTPAGAGAPAGASEQSVATSRSEVARIFMNTARTGALPDSDLRYVAQLVAQRTGLDQQEAEKRVGETFANLQASLRKAEAAAAELADKTRRASAYTALWLFISLLIGAFIASLAATYGGRSRDAQPVAD